MIFVGWVKGSETQHPSLFLNLSKALIASSFFLVFHRLNFAGGGREGEEGGEGEEGENIFYKIGRGSKPPCL
jgi:hypothetical protein